MEPGHSRTLAIRFTPPPTAAENTFLGHVIVFSNDPDDPVKQCRFSAASHVPTPTMIVRPPALLDFGTIPLGFAWTRSVRVSNTGDMPLTVGVQEAAGNTQLNRQQWRIPPHVSQIVGANGGNAIPAVFPFRYSPKATGSHTLAILVSGNDVQHPSRELTLVGKAVPTSPLASVLVLDRSAAMGASSRTASPPIDTLLWVALRYAEFLRTSTDSLGMIKFNDRAEIYLPLQLLANPHSQAARDALAPGATQDSSRLKPERSNAAGAAALQQAADLLLANTTVQQSRIVVITSANLPDRLDSAPRPWAGEAARLLESAKGIKTWFIVINSNTTSQTPAQIPRVCVIPSTVPPSDITLEKLDRFFCAIVGAN